MGSLHWWCQHIFELFKRAQVSHEYFSEVYANFYQLSSWTFEPSDLTNNLPRVLKLRVRCILTHFLLRRKLSSPKTSQIIPCNPLKIVCFFKDGFKLNTSSLSTYNFVPQKSSRWFEKKMNWILKVWQWTKTILQSTSQKDCREQSTSTTKLTIASRVLKLIKSF